MADPAPYVEAGEDTGAEPGRGSTTGPPRWVYVCGIAALVVILLFVILLLAGGHDPGRHT